MRGLETAAVRPAPVAAHEATPLRGGQRRRRGTQDGRRPQDARTLTRGDGSEDDNGGGAGHGKIWQPTVSFRYHAPGLRFSRARAKLIDEITYTSGRCYACRSRNQLHRRPRLSWPV